MSPRASAVAARAALAAWAVFTSAYAALCESPFAWTQFVRERFYPGWVALALRWHPALTLVAVALGAWALRGRGGRTVARRGWVGAACATCAALALRPLGRLEPGAAAALAALAAPLLLAGWEAARGFDPRRGPGTAAGRLSSALAAGAFCAAVSWAAGPARSAAGAAQAAATLIIALAAHLGAFGALWACRAAAAEAGAPAETVGALAALWLLGRAGLPPLGLSGAPAWVLAGAWALAGAAAWRGSSSPSVASVARRAAAGVAAAALLAAPAPLLGASDWNGLLALLAAAAAWPLAWAAFERPGAGAIAARRPPRAAAALAALAAGLLAASRLAAQADPALRPRGLSAALSADRSEAADASLRLALRALRPARRREGLFALLQAHTNLPRREKVEPVRIDLVDAITRPAAPPPDVFLFVIDSLRRDYVGAYNARARFTPAIDALAREGWAFRRSFATYGGTGLSEPSIWSGSLLIHKQYVLPFSPMNALDRLLRGLGYERLVTKDVLLSQLLDDPSIEALDERTTGHYAFCATLEELESRLARRRDSRPLFVYTQPQDLHVSVIERSRRDNVTGKRYEGFDAAYASRLERLDGCLGRFVDRLKALGLYDRSLIVVTADHGDALGEEGRWGHAYSLAPEVLRVPLVVRPPPALKRAARADLDGPAFLTDVAPTLYQLLGQGRPRLDPLLGRPLAALSGDPAAWRKREQLVAASYGPVWGLVEDGRSLLLADALEFKLLSYDLDTGRGGAASAEQAEVLRRRLPEWLDGLDALWRRH